MDHHQQTRTAQRSRASLIVLIVLAFLLMAAAIILVLSLPDHAALELPTQTTAPMISPDVGFACQDGEAHRLYPFGSAIVKLDINRISCLDITGTEQFGVDVAFSSPTAVWNDQYFLVADQNGYSFVLLDSDNLVCRGTASGQISGAALRQDGYFALILDESDGTGIISVYMPEKGIKLFDCYNPESGYPLSVSFPEVGDCFDVALVNTSGSAIQPVIKRYGIDGSLLGQRLPDSIELLPLIAYDPDGRPVLCGSQALLALTYESDELAWQIRFQQIYHVRGHTKGLLVLASEKQDGQCRLYSIHADGSQRFSLPVGDSPTSFDIRGDLALICCGKRLIAADVGQGKIVLDADIDEEIIRAGFSGPRIVTVIGRESVRRLSIPE